MQPQSLLGLIVSGGLDVVCAPVALATGVALVLDRSEGLFAEVRDAVPGGVSVDDLVILCLSHKKPAFEVFIQSRRPSVDSILFIFQHPHFSDLRGAFA